MGNIQQSRRFFVSISCEDMQQRTAPRRTVTLGVLCLSLIRRRDLFVAHAIIVGIYLLKLWKKENHKMQVDINWPRTSTLGVLRLSLVCRRDSYVAHAIIVGIYLLKPENRKT